MNILFCCFGGIGVRTKSFTLNRLVLYCLSHASSPNILFKKFIHMCTIVWNISPPLLSTPFSAPAPTPLFPGRTCSALFYNFGEETT
jgi:hypothetical protein